MEFRTAEDRDIPAIVALLKQSLGESLMPKSERYWRWKHVENPFGASPVLLCWENGELIGVRAFMRWEWTDRTHRYRAVRAVDTATHPAHQGKGIFKKLTLALVDACTQEGDHFVFNTPNEQSKPGYLKMGWTTAGRLPVKISVERPFHMLKNLLVPANGTSEEENTSLAHYLDHPSLDVLLREHLAQIDKLSTLMSSTYLRWRYQAVPVARYVAAGAEENGALTGLIIGRIKPSRLGRELRVTDCFLKKESDGKTLLGRLKESQKKWNVDYITVSGTPSAAAEKLFPFRIKTTKGPIVTTRTLTLKDLGALTNFNQWSPALGDLELF
jgi:GNAT superfamily N-acetyltransferase